MFIYSHHSKDERDFDKINRLKNNCAYQTFFVLFIRCSQDDEEKILVDFLLFKTSQRQKTDKFYHLSQQTSHSLMKTVEVLFFCHLLISLRSNER